MAYNPTVWEENDLLSIDRMNKIENGIAAASSPTAQTISFDPQETGLTAENVQDAIVEVYESSGVDIASDDEVTEMLNDVFGFPYPTSFSELYGVTINNGTSKIQVIKSDAFNVAIRNAEADITTDLVVEKMNMVPTFEEDGYVASVDPATGYIVVKDSDGANVDFTISVDNIQIWP